MGTLDAVTQKENFCLWVSHAVNLMAAEWCLKGTKNPHYLLFCLLAIKWIERYSKLKL